MLFEVVAFQGVGSAQDLVAIVALVGLVVDAHVLQQEPLFRERTRALLADKVLEVLTVDLGVGQEASPRIELLLANTAREMELLVVSLLHVVCQVGATLELYEADVAFAPFVCVCSLVEPE